MIDYWQDGKIDCKDYAIHNSIQIESQGHAPYWLVTKNHVVVAYDAGDFTYVYDVRRVYRLPRGLLKGIGSQGKSDGR